MSVPAEGGLMACELSRGWREWRVLDCKVSTPSTVFAKIHTAKGALSTRVEYPTVARVSLDPGNLWVWKARVFRIEAKWPASAFEWDSKAANCGAF